jgi:hypothetical protein
MTTTIYVAAPVARRDDGAIITADAARCETAEAAIESAERMSREQGHIESWAFTAVGNPTDGFSIDEVLSRFGSFPDYAFDVWVGSGRMLVDTRGPR